MSPRPRLHSFALAGAWLCLLGASARGAAGEFAFHHENVMGTALELKVGADSHAAALQAETRVLGEIDRLSAIFSTYDPDSELRRWQATTTPTVVSAELFAMLEACDRWRARSAGAFDPRVEALSRLWADAARRDRPPTAEELAAARAAMGPAAWRLEPVGRTAQHLSPCPLTLNAIAKGFIIDRACAAGLDDHPEIRGILLNVGGDLHVGGKLARSVDIASPRNPSDGADPLATIEVRDRSVATSGGYHRGFRIDGRWYSHIIDPRSGTPVERTVGATVVARRGADADALATIFNVLTVDESLRLAASLPDVECLLVTADGRVARSEGWGRYERPRPPVAVAVAAADVEAVRDEPAKAAPDGVADEFEMLIRFEISPPSGNSRRFRRPYVAVWVEDKEGHSVRTLVLWVQRKGRSQWVRDLLRWYRSDQARLVADKTDLKGTLSQATRSPGKHEVLWDGKDDHGRRLGPGDYTVYIEAAREHGTYQSMKKSVTLANRPFVEDLKGNVEIKSASLEYRRKGAAR